MTAPMPANTTDQVVYAAERPVTTLTTEPWLVAIVDDEPGVHEVTRLALDGFEFEGRALRFIGAHSGNEAIALLRSQPDIALVLLDVVMESDAAGLRVVDFTRRELGNRAVRFVLRTGQPGHAPEREVIAAYDISDYKTKGELTAAKLYTAVIASLRTYQYIVEIEGHRHRAEATATALRRFFPAQYLQLLDRKEITDLALGDQVQRDMTVMFVDIRGFTARSENMSPGECFAFINELFTAICPLVRAHHGIIDKFLGDGFLALFPGSADDALAAALAIQRGVAARNQAQRDDLRVGIGLHTGSLMLGTVGEAERMEATVLSDAVNLAARIESLTKRYGAGVVLSEQTLLATVDPSVHGVRSIGEVQIPGKRAHITIYELLDADPDETRAAKRASAEEFARSVELFRQGAHAEACMHLQRVLQVCPGDAAARLYLRLAAEALLSSVGDVHR